MKPALYTVAIAGTLLAAAVPSELRAQLTVDVELDAVSHYVWRGEVLADAIALQPSLTLGLGESGLALNVWGSGALRDREIHDAADELDLTLSYGRELGAALGLEVGATLYTFPGGDVGDRTSQELYASLGLDNFLAPSVTAAYDFSLVDGLYLEAGVAPELPLSQTTTLGLGASAAASNVYGRDFGLHAVQLSAGLGVDLGGGRSLTPILGFAYADDEIDPRSTQFWGGLSFGFSR